MVCETLFKVYHAQCCTAMRRTASLFIKMVCRAFDIDYEQSVRPSSPGHIRRGAAPLLSAGLWPRGPRDRRYWPA
jgi:hypothetical protein